MRNINHYIETGLNILGVVSLEDSAANSFVYVERAYPPEEHDVQTDSLPLIKDAAVCIRSSRFTPYGLVTC